jgi:hypothetical protein
VYLNKQVRFIEFAVTKVCDTLPFKTFYSRLGENLMQACELCQGLNAHRVTVASGQMRKLGESLIKSGHNYVGSRLDLRLPGVNVPHRLH